MRGDGIENIVTNVLFQNNYVYGYDPTGTTPSTDVNPINIKVTLHAFGHAGNVLEHLHEAGQHLIH